MRYFILLGLLVLTACNSHVVSTQALKEENEFHILLSSLLKINQDRHYYIDNQGNRQPDRLKAFKELESIYINIIEPDSGEKVLNQKQLKLLMFFSFYAVENNSAAFQEYLAADLMPVYVENKIKFLEILKELPFLIQANCNRLNAYFGHEGLHQDTRQSFIKENRAVFSRYLDISQYKECSILFN